MSSRIHRKNITYQRDDDCLYYSSKMYHNKNYNKTALAKHQRKQIASSSKDPPKNLDINAWHIFTSQLTKIKLIVLDVDNPINAIYD